MKSFYYFVCGVMLILTLLLFIVDNYGREFIQDYWISQLWYGDLKQLYKVIQTWIIFIDSLLIYFAGFAYATDKKDKPIKDFNNKYPID